MSNSDAYCPESRRSGRAPVRTNFAQTCNLLSHFLKGQGSFRDTSLEIAGKLEGRSDVSHSSTKLTTQFLPNIDKSGEASTSWEKPTLSKGTFEEMEPKTGQMTIFYAGQVIVFDDLPADKAREVMQLARNSSPRPAHTSCQSGSRPALDCLQPQFEDMGSDLPLVRRASLHRFLEKRKDRVNSRAPYQLHSPATESPKHDQEQLELKL